MKSPRMRITVGTLLLGLGGCASKGESSDGGCKPPHCHANPGPEELQIRPPEGKTTTPEVTREPEVTPDAKPDAKPGNGGCEPPDCHINPGPTEDPGAKVEPTPKPIPKPIPKPAESPKRVNTGPNG